MEIKMENLEKMIKQAYAYGHKEGSSSGVEKDISNELLRDLIEKNGAKSINLIYRIGDYMLGYKVFIQRDAGKDEIEICRYDKDGKTRYTIASFDYNDDNETYEVRSCMDRLNDNIDWDIFGKLVEIGYEHLLDRGYINKI